MSMSKPSKSSLITSNVVAETSFITAITASGAQFEIDLDTEEFRRVRPVNRRRRLVDSGSQDDEEPKWLRFMEISCILGAPMIVTLANSGRTYRSTPIISMRPCMDNPRQGLLL